MERKLSDSETYEEVIWDVLEDVMEISEETKKEIEEARREIREGKYYTLEQVKQELNEWCTRFYFLWVQKSNFKNLIKIFKDIL